MPTVDEAEKHALEVDRATPVVDEVSHQHPGRDEQGDLGDGRDAPVQGDSSTVRSGERNLGKRSSLVVAAGLCALAFTAPAQAGLLSGTLPGLLSPSDKPSVCDTTVSQPFSRWGDTSYYVLVPGGSFEPGSPAWSLGGGARVVSGNEPYYVHSKNDKYSLYMPAGSSVTTPPMCFAAGDWKVRVFATGGTVRVKIVVKSLLGILSVLDGGTVSSGGTWQPSAPLKLTLTNLTGILATDSISLRLVSGSTSVRIDDAYLDPWKST